MNRKGRLLVLFFFLLIIILSFLSVRQLPDLGERKIVCKDCNILIITIDALRSDHVGVYGYDRNTTPFIDGFSSGSVLFSNAVTSWPKTSPSMAGMHTGLYGAKNGVMRGCGISLPKSNFVLAEALKELDYKTGAVVSNPNLSPLFNFNQGMDYHTYTGDNTKDNANNTFHSTIKILDNISSEKFFLWVHFMDPHSPYNPPADITLGNNTFEKSSYLEFDESEDCESFRKPCERDKLASLDYLSEYILNYDREIRYVDVYIEEIIKYLKKKNLMDNTLIILTADHGESLGEHEYYFNHGLTPFEASTRIPFMIYHKDLPKGIVIDTPITLLDVMPTILGFVDYENNMDLEGVDLQRIIFSKNKDMRRYVYTHSGYQESYMKSVRDERYKLVYAPNLYDRYLISNYTDKHGIGFLRLYDIKEDTEETNNLFWKNPFVSARLSLRLAHHIISLNEVDFSQEQVEKEEIDENKAEIMQQLKDLGYIK